MRAADLPASARLVRVASVEVGPEELVVQIDQRAVDRCATELKSGRGKGPLASQRLEPVPSCLFKPEVEVDRDAQRTRLSIAIQIKRHDGRRVLVTPDGRDLLTTLTTAGGPVAREHLVRAIAQAHHWAAQLRESGDKPVRLNDVATRAGVAHTRIDFLLPLAHLAPEVVRAALSGTLPTTVSLKDLVTASHHRDWCRQALQLGLAVSEKH